MAGMLAARVLSDHFEWVTIVEKDRYPSSIAARAGVPQSRHLHALLLRGLQIVTRLFPGIDKELVAAGAVPVDVARDFAWYTSAGWAVNFDSGMEMLSFTRELLDWHIRQRVEALPNIQILDECGAMGLVEHRGSATGILLEGCRGANIDAGEQLRADLVVDATGHRPPVTGIRMARDARLSSAGRDRSQLASWLREQALSTPNGGALERTFHPGSAAVAVESRSHACGRRRSVDGDPWWWWARLPAGR
jgi:2-polyprenyl-6-methoxyphenol hydroxylase-like FAD-dependent oxidoreductase